MATGTSPMADFHIEPEVGSSPPQSRTIPSASSTSVSVQPIPIQQSRLEERSAIAQADGLMNHNAGHTDGVFEADDDDFVAVDHDDVADSTWYFRQPTLPKPTQLDELHPFVQILSVSNADECVQVESAFPENERCSREKILYRLTKCPELSLGVFSRPRIAPHQERPKATLVAHILATRTPAPAVTDASMELPENWRHRSSTLPNASGVEPLGHQDQGSTIAIHSLAVVPEHQGKGLGKTLMKAYIQRIRDAKIADRIALLSHDHLVPFYTSLGFKNCGPSECTFGGGGWHSLILEF
ncbi:acetyltransferase [Coccidioides immitis RS]|uniref:Acetyltransferase n=4 Tax=Coccidioides immitis TaxID=5501 RepID=J3K508_COCIM|nr:acetyltransferase [Coccidioides immitis RS]KMP06595.1 acetyltransferase [Coccidioides immitis RMSCC 2394]KMU73734.1 acetyltransferase [Coccidioides immitis RMSCC 3703]KMU84165.1 acetyltransferase [Coccidioides immitis H538.4]TPX22472.1 hypothetical protein DIZ76_014344 [Coccidioides immitis]EAS29449.3 acetyltransferase [Coccidioides immitis RS]